MLERENIISKMCIRDRILVKEGYVKNNYIAAMQEREKIVSTYIGMGIAIPVSYTHLGGCPTVSHYR